jgi:hypothetical protein
MRREIDFQGATLPNGRSIQGILDDNGKLQMEVSNLRRNLSETASILTNIIPNRSFRIIVQLILVLGTVWGIVSIFIT